MIRTLHTKMDIQYARAFRKQYDQVDVKIRSAFKKRLEIFSTNPQNPFLHNHKLVGWYQGFRSINIAGDWRAIFEEMILGDGKLVIVFHTLGTHSQLYK